MQSPLVCCGTTVNYMKRVCIYPKDLCGPLGIGERQAQRKIREVRKALDKKKHQYLTINEFCEYMGIPRAEFADLIP